MQRILIGTPVKNCGRFLPDLVGQVLGLDYPRERFAVGFLENDSRDDSWARVQEAQRRLKQAGIAAHVERRSYGVDIPHASRHRPEIMSRRHWCIRRARQAIVDLWLADHDAVAWLDADFEIVPPYTLTSLSGAGAPIVMPVCVTAGGVQYDLHTARRIAGRWVGVQELLRMYPDLTLIPVDRVDGACYMRREVLQRFSFTRGGGPNVAGPSRPTGKETDGLERLGLPMLLHRGVVIQHASVDGSAPWRRRPQRYRPSIRRGGQR